MHSEKIRISILAMLIMHVAFPLFSQLNTYSPYTRFGLGNLYADGFGQNAALGGAGIAIKDETKLNYMNPAAYTARDSMSVMLDFGMESSLVRYATSVTSKNWWNANFHHVGLSIPIGNHFAIGTGVVPFTSVGYNLKQEYDDLGTGDAIDYYYNGYGGVFKYFLGASAEFFERISVGVNMNYLMGDIIRQRILDFPRNRGFAETSATDRIQMAHLYFGYGIQYKEVIKDKFFFTLGATFDPETQLSSAFSSYVTSVFDGSSGYINDSTVISYIYDLIGNESDGAIILPSKLGVGLAVGIPNKLLITGDYTIQDWSSVDNSVLDVEGFGLGASRSIRGGIEYIPNINAFRGYHNLMNYRLGGYMNDSYAIINGYQLKDYGITFGVGLPMGRTRSSLNTSFTFGTRGTKENNLIKENYGILTFSVTLHDLWFFKRKYD